MTVLLISTLLHSNSYADYETISYVMRVFLQPLVPLSGTWNMISIITFSMMP